MHNASETKSTIGERGQWLQALYLWGVFIVVAVLLNGTVPFMLGSDLRAWTYSQLKDVSFNLIVYGGLFLVIPLAIVKGWTVVRRPGFLIPLIVAILAMTLRTYYRPIAVIAVIILLYLHWRFDLSPLGIRSLGWKGDLVAILLFGLIYSSPSLFRASLNTSSIGSAFQASLDRLLLNPASTTEYLFYFGFLAERLASKTGKWVTPLVIAGMYTAHEMSNPEYWYEGTCFGLVFIGLVLTTSIYLWRRSTVVIWLGDGLGRFVSRLLSGMG